MSAEQAKILVWMAMITIVMNGIVFISVPFLTE